MPAAVARNPEGLSGKLDIMFLTKTMCGPSGLVKSILFSTSDVAVLGL